jgi:hypothetical protein
MSDSVAIVTELEDIRMLKVTDEIREAARRLLTRHLAGDVRKLLEAIVDGKRKLIDENWWRKAHGDVDRAKLDKLAALADPTRNTNEHERQVASAKLAAAKVRRPPGMEPEPPPLPANLSEWVRVRRPRKTKTVPSPQPQPDPVILELSDSATPLQTSVSVARLKALNERRAAGRAAKRASLKCQSCGKPLAARRVTARYCNATCRSQAWRAT